MVVLPKVSGIYTLPVYYNGDDKFNANSTIVSVNIAWGDDYLLNATVNGTGYVTVNIDSRAVNNVSVSVDSQIPVNVSLTTVGDVNVGYYQLPDGLSVGAHIVCVSYAGDDNLGPKSYSFIYNAPKKSSLIRNVAVDPVIEGSKSVVNVTMDGNELGMVIVEIGGLNVSAVIKDGHVFIEFISNVTISGIVYYLGDDEFAPASPYVFTAEVIPKADSIVNITTETLTIGGSATISATVNGVSSTNITYIINGVKTNTIEDVEAITYTVTASFEGNSTHKANSTTSTFVVFKKDSEIKNVIVNQVINGTETIVNVTMNSTESGNVIVEIDGVNYTVKINNAGNTLFKILLTKTTVGKVYYFGDDVFDSAVAKEFEAVVNSKADSVVNITTESLTIGKSITIVATVNGAFSTNITYIINGVKTDTIPFVVGGEYTVVAVFEGNSTHKAGNASKTFTVNKLDTPIIITVNETYNVTDTINIDIKAPVDVVVTVNGEVFNPSKTSYAAGVYTVLVVFDGNSAHKSNTTSKTFAVNKLDSIVSINVGDSYLVNDTIRIGVDAPMDAIITVNGMVFDKSKTSYVAGIYTVVVSVSENATHKANSTAKTFTVTKLDSGIKNVSITPDSMSDNYIVNVTMNSTESGSVIIEIDGANYTVSINDGNALFDILLESTTNGKVYYMGNDLFNPACPVSFEAVVNPKSDSIVDITADELIIGDSVTITATVNNVTSTNIKFIINGVETKTIEDVEAITYTIVAVFEGNSTHKANITTKTFNVEKSDSIVNINYEFDVDGNVIVSVEVSGATGQVNIIVNGSDHLINLDGGMCNYTIVNPVTGDYKITAKFLGDNKYNASENTINFTVNGKAVVDPDTAFINPDKDNPTLFAITLLENATGNFHCFS